MGLRGWQGKIAMTRNQWGSEFLCSVKDRVYRHDKPLAPLPHPVPLRLAFRQIQTDKSTWEKDKFGLPIPPLPPQQSGTPRGNITIPGFYNDPNDQPREASPAPTPVPSPAQRSYPPANAFPDQPLHTSSLGPPDNQGQQSVPDQSPPPSQGDADPMANLYNKVAFAPGVQSGYDNFQMQYAPDDTVMAARGGHIINRALQIARRHRDAGGVTALWPSSRSSDAGSSFQYIPQDVGLIGSQSTGAGNDAAAAMMIGEALGTPSATMASIFGGNSPQQGGPSVVNSPYNPGPKPQTYTPPTDPGNSSITGPKYQNTLNQVLGTNAPTMQEMFGFNYPNIPPPQPNIYAQPQGTTQPGGSYNAPSTGSSGSASDTINQGSFLPGGGSGSNSNPALAEYDALMGINQTPTGRPPLLTNPAPIQTINGVPSIMPPLIASGTVGNYSNFNPSGLSSNEVPMATPWGGNVGMPLASARGGHISRALHLAHLASARSKRHV